MTTATENIIAPGMRIRHPEYGRGVALGAEQDGYIRAFFGSGERLVPIGSLQLELTRAEQILGGVSGGHERALRAWLSFESHALPLMENAPALTSAKIDLLPHQVVLTHRVANAHRRRFLIADEVGLGKTIETALLLRELASKGELSRALIVVPAGLVNNWHRELNEVFHLDFEVFGSEGDVTDRKSNAFAKHDRLIASIDTLKRPARIKRLMEAPPWDLIVFDEAHHLTALRHSGRKVKKTENYKLGEALGGRTRDILMLSATPHQGDHFRFWMLTQLLDPGLFCDPTDMVENRHRLNQMMIRRTKADACRPDGSPLFARRQVTTESSMMSDEEKFFYDKLRDYLMDGFNLARRQGNQGRALGFLMVIFQKIAASSFAAVRRTLRKRLLALTLHESLLRDKALDAEGREQLLSEAREMIHNDMGLPRDNLGRIEADRILADMKFRLAKKLDEERLEQAADNLGAERLALEFEDAAPIAVSLALPKERERIRELLAAMPAKRETKVAKLLEGLGKLWSQDPKEKIVVFATYLGTVELLIKEIDGHFPDKGTTVLKGGDHGAKAASLRRFQKTDGPRVMVCTAAGREGINLQFARVLFNFDLPWNPMDMEQRIGRIHRYGQRHTAQVYNLALSDTIEGKIFMMLDEKLEEIARAVGKIDDAGNVAEDLRSQILGQLSERINYDRLYQEALSDPELKRTAEELEAALQNSKEARDVVFDLFQSLEGFSLDDYRPYSDVKSSVERLVEFFSASAALSKQKLQKTGDETYDLLDAEGASVARFTTNRERATEDDGSQLMGLDHPLVKEALDRWRTLPPEEIGISVSDGTGGMDGSNGLAEPAMLSMWAVEVSKGMERRASLLPIAVDLEGKRLPAIEHQAAKYFRAKPSPPALQQEQRMELFEKFVEPALQREIKHRNAASFDGDYRAELIGYIEIAPQNKG
ncbi:MAG: DEAD/DEAH box helicase family protein [Holophagales bacterium]|jgi:superfamily II DNA or RNA helicase|nr:DEAD/DEAH box helicase family protein [Holophagales bacterium]